MLKTTDEYIFLVIMKNDNLKEALKIVVLKYFYINLIFYDFQTFLIWDIWKYPLYYDYYF